MAHPHASIVSSLLQLAEFIDQHPTIDMERFNQTFYWSVGSREELEALRETAGITAQPEIEPKSGDLEMYIEFGGPNLRICWFVTKDQLAREEARQSAATHGTVLPAAAVAVPESNDIPF